LLVHFDRGPLLRHVVICIVTPLLGLNKGVRNGTEMGGHRLLRVFGRAVFESGVNLRDPRFVLVQREAEGKFLAEGKDSALRAGIFKA
jgi:hypothetical protein